MIRDAGISGENIFILEVKPLLGGSMDGTGNSIDGYSLRGGRMLTTDNYECTWDLFKSIPSLHTPDKSVYEETLSTGQKFNRVKEGFGIEVNVKDEVTKEIKTKTKNAFR